MARVIDFHDGLVHIANCIQTMIEVTDEEIKRIEKALPIADSKEKMIIEVILVTLEGKKSDLIVRWFNIYEKVDYIEAVIG